MRRLGGRGDWVNWVSEVEEAIGKRGRVGFRKERRGMNHP